MKKTFLALVCVALGASLARAQSRTVTIQPSDADALALTGTVATLPDAGCTLQVTPTVQLVNGVVVQTSPHPFNGARCAGTGTALRVAFELDVGVGDGGLP